MKRVFSMILLLVVMASLHATAVLAAGAPQIVVSSTQVAQGESVSLDVAMKNNPGINTFTLSIEYDHSRLALKGVTQSSALGGTFIYTSSTETVGWQVGSDTTYSGTAFTLNFEVLDDAPLGDASVTITYKPGNICNFDEEDVDFDIMAGTVTVKAAPHDCQWDDGIVTTDPTCETKGVKTFTCGVCGETYTEDVAMLPHDTELQNVKETTCSEEGYTGDEVCKNCGTTVKSGESIDKKPHDYKMTVIAPTCKERGYTTYTCTCGHSYKADYVDALGHTGGEATCVDLAVCTRCGEEYGTVNADNHADIGELVGAKAPTCTEDGATGAGSCSACGTELKKSEVIPMLGHAMDDGVVTMEPGCEEEGVRTYSCTRDGCGYQDFEKIDPVGHDWDEGAVTTEATCEGEGEMTFTCKNDASHTRTEPIDPIGHIWELTEMITVPTCEADGEGLYTCKSDERHTKTDVIEKMGHDWDVGVVTKEPTTEQDGEKIYTCQNDPAHTQTETIEKLKPSGSGSAGDDKDTSDVPETGDETPVAMYALMGVLCMAGAVVVLSLRKKFER